MLPLHDVAVVPVFFRESIRSLGRRNADRERARAAPKAMPLVANLRH
jgi:hypothetical protein